MLDAYPGQPAGACLLALLLESSLRDRRPRAVLHPRRGGEYRLPHLLPLLSPCSPELPHTQAS